MQILNERWLRLLSWIAVGAVVAAITALHVLVLHRQDFADDLYFSTALDQRPMLEFLAFRYSRWTGRIPIEFMLVAVVNHVWLWKLLNIAMFMLLAFSLARLGVEEKRVTGSGIALAACLVLLVTPDVLWWSAWWLTGSINYLWPVALGAFALSVYLQPATATQWQIPAALVGGSIAVYSEQVAIVLLAIGGLMLAWRWINGTATVWHFLFVLATALNAAIGLTAPGNANRFAAEHATWFPDFAVIGFADKLNIGLGLVSGAVLTPGNWLLLLAAFVAALVVTRPSVPRVISWCLMPGLLWIVCNQLFGMIGYEPVWRFGFPLSPASASRPIAYAAMAVSIYSVASLIAAVGVSLPGRGGLRELSLALALAVGAFTLLLIGWSPTSTASGSRTGFVLMMVVVVVTTDLLTRLREEADPRIRIAYFLTCTAAVAGGLVRVHGLLTGQ